MLASRRCDFEHAAGVPITGLRRNQPQVPHERHSPNLIELGFIVCRISRHLSINISCPLLMDNRFCGTSCIRTVSKPALSSRTCCFPGKCRWPGEALGLSWDDVEFPKSRITVRRSLQRVKGVMTLLSPKTEGSHRTIDLPAVTIAALRQHQIRQGHAQEWAGSGWVGNSWNLAFTTTKGTPLDERGVLRRFQDRILKNADVPKMRIHDLRHSAVAILIAQGVDARSISELLGHSSVAFTLQVYGHLMEETKRETASKMDSALAPRKPVAPSLAPSGVSREVM